MTEKTIKDVKWEKKTLIKIGKRFNKHMDEIMNLTGTSAEEWSVLVESMNALIDAKGTEIKMRKISSQKIKR